MIQQRTRYCGRFHRFDDGVPLNHACRVLDPKFLRAEREERYEVAAVLLERMPLELHGGVVDAHGDDSWRRPPDPPERGER